MFVGQFEYHSQGEPKKTHKPISVQDLLDVNALCAGSIAAITTGAAAIAPYGAAVHAGCAENKFLKNPKSQALLSALWTAPEFDPLAGTRRLEQKPTAEQSLEESLAQIEANRASLEELKKATSVPEAGNTEADTRLAIWRLHLEDLKSHFLTFLALCLHVTGRSDRKTLLECQGQMAILRAKLGLKIQSCSTRVNGLVSSTFGVVMKANMQNIEDLI